MRDPRKQEMNQEVSALYKAEGVNPVGGCLPMVIQMPFLFAYYSMLGAAIDLRQAPWLWIHDLSSPDPWHLLPIGIIVTMLVTQTHDAPARHGSVAAKNDDLHDAADAGRHQLEPGRRPVPVLVRGQPDRNRPTGGDEPYQPGPRDAGDCIEAGEEER